MTFKIIIDPVTGKASTTTGPDEEQIKRTLEETRREVKNIISGNTQFHQDPANIEKKMEEKVDETHEEWYHAGGWGYFPEELT